MSPGQSAVLLSQTAPRGQGVEVTLEHSWPWSPWTSLLALAVLVAIVLVIYLRESRRASRSFRLGLAALRITILALVLFMMYGWTQHRHRTDLPDIILALDDSLSMGIEDHRTASRRGTRLARWTGTSGFDRPTRFNLARTLLLNERNGWLDSLSQRYRVKLFLLGETARMQGDSDDTLAASIRERDAVSIASRLGQNIQQMLDLQRGRPTAAIVALTDGITTDGPSLSEVARIARQQATPLFLVGLGDERPPRDVRLSDLLVDDIVFVDDVVNFEFKLHSHGYAGQPAVVRLRRTDGSANVVAQQSFTLPADGVALPAALSFRPQQDGTFEYELEVLPLEGEVDRENNRLRKRLQVRSAAVRVLLVQGYPNYEFRFLKNLLGRLVRPAAADEKLVDLTTVLLDADPQYTEQDSHAARVFPVARETLESFDVLIMGDVDPEALGQSIMTNIVRFVQERGGGVVLIAGSRFTPRAYVDTPLAEILPLDLRTVEVPEADAMLEQDYAVRPTPLGWETPHLRLANSADQSAAIWQQLPGLRWLLTADRLSPAARVLLHHPQRTDSSGTPLPVVWLQFVGAGKVVFHATDETYRWSRFQGSDDYYARYWLQTLRYLSRAKLLSGIRSAEVLTDRSEYRQGDDVHASVRFHDERSAPAGDDGVELVIEDERGRRQQMGLRRESTRRDLFSGTLRELGVGRYRAWLSLPLIQSRPKPREFAVLPAFGEQVQLRMDSADLRAAAKISGGRFYTFDKSGRLLRDLPRGRQVRVESLPPEPVWNSSLLIATLVGLITAEWILRKRAGLI